MQNAANTPFCTFASTPPHLNLANQLQSSQLFDVAGTSESCIDFQWDEWKPIFYLCHCLPFTIGETISIYFYSNLTAIQAQLLSMLISWGRENVSSQQWVDSWILIHVLQTLSSLRFFCVSDDSNQIQFFLFVLRNNSIQTQFISNK